MCRASAASWKTASCRAAGGMNPGSPAWAITLHGWPAALCLLRTMAAQGMSIHQYLTVLAARYAPGESGLLALDWWNGNRSVLADADLTGMLLGMTLRTKPEEIYRALIEATAYGMRMVTENYRAHGVAIDEVFALGGISQKNAMAMQIYADVLGMPVRVVDCAQGGAQGSAILAAAAAGVYASVADAVAAMAAPVLRVYEPEEENVQVYNSLFGEYKRLHDYFGRGENDVMKRLKQISRDAAGTKEERV